LTLAIIYLLLLPNKRELNCDSHFLVVHYGLFSLVTHLQDVAF
jgi:hypothetical protein